jgi:Ca2+/H+ antiporter, TMEM165/GDT1 family
VGRRQTPEIGTVRGHPRRPPPCPDPEAFVSQLGAPGLASRHAGRLTVNVQNVNPAPWDWQVFGTVLSVIFLAQLPGKSALTALVLSSRYRALPVLLGAALALAAHSVIAVATGGLLSLLPARPVHIAAGLLFMVSAIFVWRGRPRAGEQAEASGSQGTAGFTQAFGISFTATFVAEWGDLTQLATAALAARYGELLVVLAGAAIGLWAATGIAILIGGALGHLLRPALVQRIAAVVFAALGVALVMGIL